MDAASLTRKHISWSECPAQYAGWVAIENGTARDREPRLPGFRKENFQGLSKPSGTAVQRPVNLSME